MPLSFLSLKWQVKGVYRTNCVRLVWKRQLSVNWAIDCQSVTTFRALIVQDLQHVSWLFFCSVVWTIWCWSSISYARAIRSHVIRSLSSATLPVPQLNWWNISRTNNNLPNSINLFVLVNGKCKHDGMNRAGGDTLGSRQTEMEIHAVMQSSRIDAPSRKVSHQGQ